MKKYMTEFIRRGLISSGFGPLVLAVLYLIHYHLGHLQTLSVNEVCLGIITLFVLAFIAGGMNVIYQIERLPLMIAILLHGFVLYVSYLITYLVNGWLKSGTAPIIIFTAIFILSYLAIWAVIYSINKRNTQNLNESLQKKQQTEEKASYININNANMNHTNKG